ncbi:hypothetical protein LIA77_10325 [Sarocladium implicatum]|nr:hypothetical protein LIA77_10325 [Sarocladium implicatum]
MIDVSACLSSACFSSLNTRISRAVIASESLSLSESCPWHLDKRKGLRLTHHGPQAELPWVSHGASGEDLNQCYISSANSLIQLLSADGGLGPQCHPLSKGKEPFLFSLICTPAGNGFGSEAYEYRSEVTRSRPREQRYPAFLYHKMTLEDEGCHLEELASHHLSVLHAIWADGVLARVS